MKFLRGLLLSLLGLLLFLSLSLFGIAYTLQSTLLNPSFIANQVNKIDVSDVVKDVAGDGLAQMFPQDVGAIVAEAIIEVIDEQEPWLKEQVGTIIYTAYDYLLGESDTILINIKLEPLRDVLKESLREKLWEIVSQQFTASVADLSPEQIEAFIDQHYQEIIGQIPSQYLPAEVSLLPDAMVKEYLKDNYQELLAYVPEDYLEEQLAPVLQEQLDQYFEQYFDDFAWQYLPAEIEFTQENIPPDVMPYVLSARQYIDYFQTWYYPLIAFMALLALAIVFLDLNIGKGIRRLGIALLTYGALEFAGVVIARQTVQPYLSLAELPASLETWLLGLYAALWSPLQVFTLGCLVAGVVMVVASFFIKPRAVAE